MYNYMDKITRKQHRNIRVVFPDPVSPRTMVTSFDAILRMSDSRPGRREGDGIGTMIDIKMKGRTSRDRQLFSLLSQGLKNVGLSVGS